MNSLRVGHAGGVSSGDPSKSHVLGVALFRITAYRYQKSSRTASHVKRSFATRRVAAPVLSMVRHFYGKLES